MELRPEHERIIKEQLASGQFKSVDEILTTALSSHPHDRFDRETRREATRRMIEFGERRHLSLGEPVTRGFLHEVSASYGD